MGRGHVAPEHIRCATVLANGAVMAEACTSTWCRPDQMKTAIDHLGRQPRCLRVQQGIELRQLGNHGFGDRPWQDECPFP